MKTVIRANLEAKLREDAAAAARQLGIECLRLDYDGWPDRIFLTPRKPLFMEFKRPGDTPRPLQVHRLHHLAGLGYLDCWEDGWADNLDTLLERLYRALQP